MIIEGVPNASSAPAGTCRRRSSDRMAKSALITVQSGVRTRLRLGGHMGKGFSFEKISWYLINILLAAVLAISCIKVALAEYSSLVSVVSRTCW